MVEPICYEDIAIVIDHEIKGRAILWTDSPQGIRIRSLRMADQESELILVATQGDIENEAGMGAVIQASLMAPKGSIRGLDGTIVVGQILMDRFPTDIQRGCAVRAPMGPRFDPEKGKPLTPEEMKIVEIYMDSSFLRVDSRRRRRRGVFGG